MTALEYMEKQLKKHRANYVRESLRGASDHMLDDIKSKISYYELAVEALRSVMGEIDFDYAAEDDDGLA